MSEPESQPAGKPLDVDQPHHVGQPHRVDGPKQIDGPKHVDGPVRGSWRKRPWWTWPGLVLALALITIYQRVISPFLGANCRFHPTCSRYTYEAILKYGVVRGVMKGAVRISKCHPWHPGGVDYP